MSKITQKKDKLSHKIIHPTIMLKVLVVTILSLNIQPKISQGQLN